MPTVSTYHGYAASLVSEHGLRIGVEPGAEGARPGDVLGGQAAPFVSG
jgi:DNA helicase-2/ATP-dependent DNA helicase PcrA